MKNSGQTDRIYEVKGGGLPRRPVVVIAYPTMDMDVSAKLTQFLLATEAYNSVPEAIYRFEHVTVNDCRPVAKARNVLVRMALDMRPPADYVWFLDSDSAPNIEALELLGSLKGVDILGGIVPVYNPQRPPCLYYNVYKRHTDLHWSPVLDLPDGQVVDVDGFGTACMLVSARVLRDKRMWCGKPKADSEPLFRFQYDIDGGWLKGEDLDFCWRAKELGYKVQVNTSIKVGHHKTVDLEAMMGLIRKAYMKGVEDGERIRSVADVRAV